MSAALRPCPWCGGEASPHGEVNYHDSHEAFFADGTQILKAYFVNCLQCGVTNKGLLGHQTREKSIVAWNRRPAPMVEQGCKHGMDTDRHLFGYHDEPNVKRNVFNPLVPWCSACGKTIGECLRSQSMGAATPDWRPSQEPRPSCVCGGIGHPCAICRAGAAANQGERG